MLARSTNKKVHWCGLKNFDKFDNSDNVESHSTPTRSGVAEIFLPFASYLCGVFFDKHSQLLYGNIMNGDIYHAVFCLQVENLLDIVAVVDEVLIKTSDVWTVVYKTGCTTIPLKFN